MAIAKFGTFDSILKEKQHLFRKFERYDNGRNFQNSGRKND